MLSHVAFLVPSVAACARRLAGRFELGAIEEYPPTGTRELYVGANDSGSLLLMEAIGPGAYERARAKRGFGLHHVAVDVADPAAYVMEMGSTGWLLHPISLAHAQRGEPFFLARPGVKTLIEVQRLREGPPVKPFITRIEVECESKLQHLPGALKVSGIVGAGETRLWIDEKPFALDELLRT